MKVIQKLTLEYMKQNKARTFVTIFGVLIAVAMITATLAIASSSMNLFQRMKIEESGEWYAQLDPVNRKDLAVIKKITTSKI